MGKTIDRRPTQENHASVKSSLPWGDYISEKGQRIDVLYPMRTERV
jgi:hypothetical protein